jgi:hypothetical protein
MCRHSVNITSSSGENGFSQIGHFVSGDRKLRTLKSPDGSSRRTCSGSGFGSARKCSRMDRMAIERYPMRTISGNVRRWITRTIQRRTETDIPNEINCLICVILKSPPRIRRGRGVVSPNLCPSSSKFKLHRLRN